MSISRRILTGGATALALLIAGPILMASAPRGPTIIYVDDDNCPGPGDGSVRNPYCSIQTAIDNAVGGDEIVVAQGEYFENINFLGKPIAVRSSDGPRVTTIDAGGSAGSAVRAVSFEGPDTVFQGFTVTGGSGDANASGTTQGGGMRVFGSDPTVTDCIFAGNTADVGGGMYLVISDSTVSGCTFSNNQATEKGGGLYSGVGDPYIFDCTFVGNSAATGGGLWVLSQPALEACTILGNTAEVGGGLAIESSAMLAACAIIGNDGTLGGGVFARGGEFIECELTGNVAVLGGGVYNDGADLHFVDCQFAANDADFDGGGMYSIGGEPTLSGCTFSSNTASTGGAMYNVTGHPVLVDSSFDENTATEGGGIYNLAADAILIGCSFGGNLGQYGGGGGIFNDGSSAVIARCTFSGNGAIGSLDNGVGGAMYNIDSDVTLVSCLLAGNAAGILGFGGAIFSADSSQSIINCTFAQNVAAFGSALGSWGASETRLSNCILWGGYSPQILDFDGAITTARYSTVEGGFPGEGNLDADPLFADPDSGDFRLMPGSPCIDAGDNTAIPFRTTDRDGNRRLVDDPATRDTGNPPGHKPIVDMGAYEHQGR